MTGICKHHEIQYRKAFKASRKKATPARLAILEVLEHAKTPLSAEEIRKALPGNKSDLVTVYRNLELLKNSGWVIAVNLGHQAAYYELADLKHHHHLVCENCGRIAEMDNCEARILSKESLKTKGFARVLRHSLEYFGVCNQCSKNN